MNIRISLSDVYNKQSDQTEDEVIKQIQMKSFKNGMLHARQVLINNYGYEQCSEMSDTILDAHNRLKFIPLVEAPEQSDDPSRCCQNGKFGEDHICQKQSGI
jgi:hypothetical protein